MSENSGRDMIESLNKDPIRAGNNRDQRFGIAAIQLGASIVQEADDRTEKDLVAAGYPTEKAKEIAQNPNDAMTSKVMGGFVDQALKSGANEYAILSSIHNGTLEGHQRAKHNFVVNYFKDALESLKYRLRMMFKK